MEGLESHKYNFETGVVLKNRCSMFVLFRFCDSDLLQCSGLLKAESKPKMVCGGGPSS